jgi:hypothetical protein
MRGRKRRGERFGVEGVAGGFTAAGCLPKAAAGCAVHGRCAAFLAGVQGCGLLPRVTARRGRHALPGESRRGEAATPYRASHGLVGPPRLAVGGVLFPDYMSARKRGIARSTRMVVFRMTYGPITAETIAADSAAATCPRGGGGYRLGQGGGAPEAAGTARVSIHDVSGAFDAGDGLGFEEDDAGVRKGKVPSDQ